MIDRDPVDIRTRLYPVRMSTRDRTDMMDDMAGHLSDIVSVMDPATVAAGVGWYPLARRVIRGLARHHDDTVTVDMMTGLVAATSPRMSWPDNLAIAHRVATDPVAVSSVIRSVRPTVAAIRSGVNPRTAIRGSKSRSFHLNLSGDTMAVTVDRWMVRAMTGQTVMDGPTVKAIDRVGSYDMMADTVRMVADMAPWPVKPSELQAAIWIHIRSMTASGRVHHDRLTMDDDTDPVATVAAIVNGDDMN